MERKSNKLYYKISEVSHITGVAEHVLRYWEKKYKILKPKKSKSGKRIYSREDIENIRKLKGLLEKGFSLKGAIEKLSGKDVRGKEIIDDIKKELKEILEILGKD